MWEPVFYARNSGGMVKDKAGELVGGLHWYIPSGVHDHHTPLGHTGSMLSGVETLAANAMPPWIMQVRDGKVFVGERLNLSARLNVNGERHPHAMNDQRAIPYAFGFIGEAGRDRVPSYEDMRAMSASWWNEIGRLLTKLNEDVAESFLNRDHLKKFAKQMQEVAPEGMEIGAKYGNSLWDRRAQQVNDTKDLERPVLVNAYELAPDRNWEGYTDFEIDGVGSKKKTPKTSSTFSTSLEEGLETSKTAQSNLREFSTLFERKPLVIASVASLTLGATIGLWVFHHRNRQTETKRESKPQMVRH